VACRALDELVGAIASGVEGQTPLRAFRAVGEVYVGWAMDHPRLYHLVFGSGARLHQGHPEMRAAAGRLYGQVCAVVHDGQQTGVIRPGSTEDIAFFAWVVVHGVVLLLLDDPASLRSLSTRSRQEVVDSVLEKVAQGVVLSGRV
jgi:hypothetical protein